MHKMNVWLTNVCEDCHPSSARGNKQMSFSKSFKILHNWQPCTLSVNTLYSGPNFIYPSLNVCPYVG